MPPRRRPTTRLLTPLGWIGAITFSAAGIALVLLAISQPR
jgi:hypothetical protein